MLFKLVGTLVRHSFRQGLHTSNPALEVCHAKVSVQACILANVSSVTERRSVSIARLAGVAVAIPSQENSSTGVVVAIPEGDVSTLTLLSVTAL